MKHAILEPRIGHFASEVFHFSEVTASPLYHRVQQTKARTSDLSTEGKDFLDQLWRLRRLLSVLTPPFCLLLPRSSEYTHPPKIRTHSSSMLLVLLKDLLSETRLLIPSLQQTYQDYILRKNIFKCKKLNRAREDLLLNGWICQKVLLNGCSDGKT